jgi:hypothetical protein
MSDFEEAEAQDFLDELSAEMPRAHPYLFAHRILPQALAKDPERIIAILHSDDGNAFLRTLWQAVGEQLEEKERLPPDGLECCMTRANENYRAAVICLPPPERMTEAYFTALVVFPAKRAFWSRRRAPWRYYTLEYGTELDGTGRTVFCQWKDGDHLNFGDGPPPEKEAFLERVLQNLSSA